MSELSVYFEPARSTLELNLHAHFKIGTLLSLEELTIQDRIVTSIDDEVATEVTTCRHILSSPLHEQNTIRQSDSDSFSSDSEASSDVTAEKDDHAIMEEDSGLTLDASHLKSDDLLSESGFFTESSQVVRTPRDEPLVSSDSEASLSSDSEEVKEKEFEATEKREETNAETLAVTHAQTQVEELPEKKKIMLEAPVRIANPDSFEQQDSSSSEDESKDEALPQDQKEPAKSAQPELLEAETVGSPGIPENNNVKKEHEKPAKQTSETVSETAEKQNALSEKDPAETTSLDSTTTEESLGDSRSQLDSTEDLSDQFVRPSSTSKSPKTGIKKFLRRSLPNKLIKTKRQTTIDIQSRTDSLTSLNSLDMKQTLAPKSSPQDSGNDLPDLMTPMKHFLRKPGLGQLNNFTSVDIPVENQLAEVSRKSSLVSLDQLFIGDSKGEASPAAGITRYVGSIYTGDKAFAGTDASVFLWLTDENGKTMGGKNGYKIREQGGDQFDRNTKNRLRINIKDKLGELHKLTVRHFGTGLSPDWLLSRIELTEVDEQDRPVRPLQVFGCDEWLKPKRIYELGHDQIPAKYFVKILSQKKLTDENGLFVELYGTKGTTQKRILKKPEIDSAWQVFSIPAIDLGELKAAALFNESGNDWIVERVVVVAPSGEKLVLDFQKSYINPSGLKAFL